MARVLLVDDDENVAGFLIEFLQVSGHVVTHTSRGEDAVRLASSDLPDVVLLDLTLPDAPGYEILRSLHALDPACPVIVLTGIVDPEVAEEVGRLGAFGLLRKPFDLRQLQGVVTAALAARAQG